MNHERDTASRDGYAVGDDAAVLARGEDERISGYLDGELSDEERGRFERELRTDGVLAAEFERIRTLREVTASMRLKEFPDQVWDTYWSGTYNRLERGVGWILLSIGAMVLLAAGLYELAVTLLRDSVDPWWIRAAVGACVAGLAVLFVSVLRERLFARKSDPYREVRR